MAICWERAVPLACMIDYTRHLPANPHREIGNPITEKSPYLLKVNTQIVPS